MPSSSSSSSAAPIQYSQFGRQGLGVVQPQSGTDYPLVGVPSLDIRYLLADASLVYDDPADYTPSLIEYCPPFRIKWLHGLGTVATPHPKHFPAPTHDVDIIVVDCNNCVVFDSTKATTFFSEQWTDRLAVYGWETDEATMFIVVHTKWAETADPDMTPIEYEDEITPDSATLDERAVERRPKRVKSFTVVLDNYTRTEVDFVEGFNMDITSDGEFDRGNGLRLAQRVLFDASPGNGLGIFPGCEPDPLVIRRINNIGPTTQGDFYLAANDCYYARQPSTIIQSDPRIALPTPAMLQVGNDCGPCCPCEDYVETAEYMNRIRDKYDALGRQYENIRDQYHENRDRWLDSKCCFERFPLRLVVQPQICPYLDIGAQFCNLTDYCVGGLELKICVEIVGAESSSSSISVSFPSSSSVCQSISEEVPGFTHIRGQSYKSPRRTSETERYEMGGKHPCYLSYWDAVEAAQSVWVRFRLGFNCCGTDLQNNPLFVRVTLTGQVGDPIGQPLAPITVPVCGSWGSSISEDLAIAWDQALLRCPTDSNDSFSVCPGEVDCAEPSQ